MKELYVARGYVECNRFRNIKKDMHKIAIENNLVVYSVTDIEWLRKLVMFRASSEEEVKIESFIEDIEYFFDRKHFKECYIELSEENKEDGENACGFVS